MSFAALRPRLPSPALLVACLALFAALGSATFASANTARRHHPLRFTKASLKNGWRAFGNGTAPPGYAKDSIGVVHLRGSMASGTIDFPAFVLPRNMRPKHYLYMPVVTFGNTEDSVEITPKGQILPLNGPEADTQTALDGISFVAGQ